ncbi:TPA: zinc ribbon domain-containing protein [Salmonella enterica]|nr:zinc ribbon domain-containing protein [Salmonella enterica]
MEITCPVCHHALERNGDTAHCATCAKDFSLQAICPDCRQPLQAICPDCRQPLQVLKACGAVDYFCQNGHGLISKKRVNFVITD